MIDFIKYELTNHNPEILEANTYLEFHETVNRTTGELTPFIQAKYRGLTFKIYNITTKTYYKRITVEGSLHKYYNDGKHNFNDFGAKEIKTVLNDLKNKFNIETKNCKLRQLEIGVNIKPNIETNEILSRCYLHKTEALKSIYTRDEGNYIQARHQRYIVKIYNKRLHYENKGYIIENEIMRFEIKYQKMRDLNKLSIYTLEDLLNFKLINFKPMLIKEWDNVLFYDLKLTTKNKYDNLHYWLKLKKTYSNFKYHRNIMNKLINNNQQNTKKYIRTLISEKCDALNT